jgi:hypothetical protein
MYEKNDCLGGSAVRARRSGHRRRPNLGAKSCQTAGLGTAFHHPALYVAFGGPIDLAADLAERLIAAADKSLALSPAGRAHAELLGTAIVGAAAERRTVKVYAIMGLSNTPLPVWMD